MQRDKLTIKVVSITLLLGIWFVFWVVPNITAESIIQSFLNKGNTDTSTEYARDQIAFKVNGDVQLSDSDPCIIELINLSSLKLESNEFSIKMMSELKNNFGNPHGSLIIILEGKKKKFFDLLSAINLISDEVGFVLTGFAPRRYEFTIKDGKFYWKGIPITDIDSFPELC